MPWTPGPPSRRSLRHPLHDYRQPGLYFVTVCTANRQPVFGEVRAGEMHRSAFGEIAHVEWLRTFEMRPYLVPDVFVVMPDHVHLLFGLMDDGEPAPRRRDTMHGVPTGHNGGTGRNGRFGTNPVGSVSAIIGAYKAAVTRQIRQLDPTVRVWQSRFHDRVVRNNREATALRVYIQANPSSWRERG
ncbi:MAG: transposase [Bacteroidota bacterium]